MQFFAVVSRFGLLFFDCNLPSLLLFFSLLIAFISFLLYGKDKTSGARHLFRLPYPRHTISYSIQYCILAADCTHVQ